MVRAQHSSHVRLSFLTTLTYVPVLVGGRVPKSSETPGRLQGRRANASVAAHIHLSDVKAERATEGSRKRVVTPEPA